MELSIVKHIKKYGLEKTVSSFNLICKEYDHKVILKYNMIESDFSKEEVCDARGLILEKDTWKVMSLAFRKFFNAGETEAAKIDWNSALILQKIDGSLIQLYYDWVIDEWCAGTSGMANGEGNVNNKQNLSFADLFWSIFPEESETYLDKDFIYAFELTTPFNIVVTPHGESKVTLLTIRNRNTLEELRRETVRTCAIIFVLKVQHVQICSINATNTGQLLKTFEGMPFIEEGYVVVDKDFNRIKVKNPAYVAVHHLKNSTAEYKIMTIVKSNEIEEFATTFPERRDEIFSLKKNYDKLKHTLHEVWKGIDKPKNISREERKVFAENVFKIAKEKKVTQFTGLFFNLADGRVEDINDFLNDYDDSKLYKIL